MSSLEPRRGSPFHAATDGVRIAIRLTPKAARTRVLGVAANADGTVALKIAVTAAPERGRANAALIDFLAASWHVAKRDLALVAGAGDRRKILHLSGDPAKRVAALSAWLDRTPQDE